MTDRQLLNQAYAYRVWMEYRFYKALHTLVGPHRPA